MRLDLFASLLEKQSLESLLNETLRFAHKLGFETVTATAIADHPAHFISVDNAPVRFRAIHNDPTMCARDPVIQHCKHSALPIAWDQDTYSRIGQGPKWEVQAEFGYRTGIATALHLAHGHHFFVGFDRDQQLPNDPNEVGRMVAAIQLFAVYAQDAALSLLISDQRSEQVPDLTPRELESMRWTMDGKTAWELGQILGITEQTAARHVNNATRKLGCVNKVQAVLKAVRLGLIR
jgi:DNA-binding CsgD family transcriptional regulator